MVETPMGDDFFDHVYTPKIIKSKQKRIPRIELFIIFPVWILGFHREDLLVFIVNQ